MEVAMVRFNGILSKAGRVPLLFLHSSLTLALLVNEQAACATLFNPWSRVAKPVHGTAESIGEYTGGCLRGGVALPWDGTGYQIMRPSRRRFYGHPELVRFIKALGERVADRNLGDLLIGDLGQPRGGPILSGHRSHQTGLDVDIWLKSMASAQRKRLTLEERENLKAVSVVAPDQVSLKTQAWSDSQVEVLKIAAVFPAVERIFVNPAIKRGLCKQVKDNTWLTKIRPWWGHDAHFHVRLRCPSSDPLCVPQEPPPPGDGCDGTLDWWFSEEAKVERLKKPRPPVMPILPEACTTILNQ